MTDMVFWGGIGVAVGVLFAETIRAFVRKITKGRFFGAVPASEAPKTDA